MVECDEIALSRHVWEAAQAGDRSAKDQLCRDVNGLTLYVHALSMPPGDHVFVTARELCRVLGDRLTLRIGFDE